MTPACPSVVESLYSWIRRFQSTLSHFKGRVASHFPPSQGCRHNPIYCHKLPTSCFYMPLPTDGHGCTSVHGVGPCWGPRMFEMEMQP
eukprot:8341189-Pyramimonas_sp.AAC.1